MDFLNNEDEDFKNLLIKWKCENLFSYLKGNFFFKYIHNKNYKIFTLKVKISQLKSLN